jgi:hypothetical protein
MIQRFGRGGAGAVAFAVLWGVGCNSVLGLGDLQVGVACGAGTELVDGQCEPAVNAKAPAFGGATALSPVTKTSLLVSWDAAASTTATADTLHYSVYLATKKGGEDWSSPAGTVTGATSYTLSGLEAGADYYVVVRAADAEGNQERNRVELHAQARADETPPTFAGAGAATSAEGGKIRVTWSPASDDLSGPSAITYVIYAAETSPVPATTPLAEVTGVTAGEITVPKPLTPYHVLVRAKDAAGNAEANTKEVSAISGADANAPAFGGCTAATATQSNEVQVSWNPAVDDVTPADLLWYDVYAFTTAGPHGNLDAAVAKVSVQGKTTATLDGLSSDTPYYFLCRARDLTGNVGGNPVDGMASTPKDVTPPDFPGALTAAPVSIDSYEIAVAWPAATDLQTGPSAMEYDIYLSDTPGGEDYAKPPAARAVGVTQSTVLVKPGQTTYLVVRARDEAGNPSTTIKELSVTTRISYDYQIQPIFKLSCVENCHGPGQTLYNPILSAPVSYTFIMAEKVVIPGNPTGSTLYADMTCPCDWSVDPNCTCNKMPKSYSLDPFPTQGDIDLIRDWILEDAPGPLSPVLDAPPTTY